MSRSVQAYPAPTIRPIRVSRLFSGAVWPVLLALFCFGLTDQILAKESVIASDNTTTTFIVVRHAEREGNADKLSAQGRDRAEMLRGLGKILNVSAVYSTNTQRTKNTVKPLVDDLDAKLELYSRTTGAWIEQVRREQAGGVVLIVGHSNTTGVIAGMLASKPAFAIGHDEYDAVFIVTVTESTASCVRLKYGTSSKGAADKMGPAPKQ